MCVHLPQFAFKAILKHPNPFQCKKICLNTVGIITCSALNPSRCMKGIFFPSCFVCECCAPAPIKVSKRRLRPAGNTDVFISSSLILVRPSQRRSEKETRYHLCFRTLSSLLSPSSFFFFSFFFLTLLTVMLGGADAFTGSITIQIVFSLFGCRKTH